MAPEFLSVTPQRLRCYVCGTFTESPNGWSYRVRLRGHSPVCPSCRSKAEQEIEQLASNPNLLGAVLFGAVAAAVAATGWYLLEGVPTAEKIGIAAGIGWVVGKAVVFGSGNKRGPSLQWTAGALAGAAILGGQYLILNHLVSKLASGSLSGWLPWRQFWILLGSLFAQGKGFAGLLLFTVAISCAFVVPRAEKLLSEPPRIIRWWEKLVG